MRTTTSPLALTLRGASRISSSTTRKATSGIGEPVIKMPALGGSVPFYIFTDILKTPALGVPIVNHDNNTRFTLHEDKG